MGNLYVLEFIETVNSQPASRVTGNSTKEPTMNGKNVCKFAGTQHFCATGTAATHVVRLNHKIEKTCGPCTDILCARVREKDPKAFFSVTTIVAFDRFAAIVANNGIGFATHDDPSHCSGPTCKNAVKSKAIVVRGDVFPVCGSCSSAAWFVAVYTNTQGLFPMDKVKAEEVAVEWREEGHKRAEQRAVQVELEKARAELKAREQARIEERRLAREARKAQEAAAAEQARQHLAERKKAEDLARRVAEGMAREAAAQRAREEQATRWAAKKAGQGAVIEEMFGLGAKPAPAPAPTHKIEVVEAPVVAPVAVHMGLSFGQEGKTARKNGGRAQRDARRAARRAEQRERAMMHGQGGKKKKGNEARA